MKRFLFAFYFLPLPLLAQVNGTTPPPVANDSTAAEWTLSLEAAQRSFYLGREYGDKAYSLAPSLTYSHPSGFYGTLSGYYFHESQPPRYAFTDLELGYENTITDNWVYSLSYDRVFFTPPVSSAEKQVENGLEAYTSYDLGPLHGAFDYNYFFGKSSAQTVALTLSGKIKKAHWLGLDEVSLTPGAEVMWGSPLALARYGGTYTTVATNQRGRLKAAKNVPGQTVRLLAYELTLPLEVDRGPLAYTIMGHYVIPQRTPEDTATPLPTRAYLSMQVSYTF
jgi:hypothetical protein